MEPFSWTSFIATPARLITSTLLSPSWSPWSDDLLRIAIQQDVPVLAYGIRTDFQTVAFPGSRRLLEVAHSLEELKTICRCGRKAVFNARTINGEFVFDGNQVAIEDGAEVVYESLCGACYLDESGGTLNRGWRPRIDFSYTSGHDADFA